MRPTLRGSIGARWLCVLALICSSVAAPAEAARTRRFALVVGANDGGQERVRLRYAISDARSMARVLRQLGGVADQDVQLLLEPKQAHLTAAIAALRASLERARGRREVLFYYSGHSDERGLLLGGRHVTYLSIRQAIRTLPADVRIAVLDSCASGHITRGKGGIRRPPFLVDAAGSVRGHAFLTSASATEAAQESDRIRGSFFTHHLVSGLRGAADSDRDGRVTLNEAYRYAFKETLAQTESTGPGPQHPNYDMQLVGRGEIVLTELRGSASILELPAALRGRLFVRDAQGELVAEINKRRAAVVQLGLQAGRYTITLSGTRRGAVVLQPRSRHVLRVAELGETITPTQTVRRGPPAPQVVHEAERPAAHVPFIFTVVPTIGLGGQVRTNFSIGLLVSHYAFLRGVDLGTAATVATVDVRGVQLSAGYNHIGRDLAGAQLSAGANAVLGNVKGVQGAAGFNLIGSDLIAGAQLVAGFNWVRRDMLGAQIAAGFNLTGGDVDGVQIAAGGNAAGGLVDGSQIAAGVNIARGVVDGAQVAAGLNIAPEVEGAQVSAGVNIAPKVRGAQVGIVNVGGAIRGAQVGLLNIAGATTSAQVGLINIARRSDRPVGLLNLVQEGMHHVELWASDSAYANVGLKLGGRHLYSVLAVGMQPKPDHARWLLGVGLGGRIPLSGPWALDTDLVHWKINEGEAWTKETYFLETWRLVASYRLARRFALQVGASFNALITRVDDGSDFGLIQGRVVHRGATTVRLWPGFIVGVSI